MAFISVKSRHLAVDQYHRTRSVCLGVSLLAGCLLPIGVFYLLTRTNDLFESTKPGVVVVSLQGANMGLLSLIHHAADVGARERRFLRS